MKKKNRKNNKAGIITVGGNFTLPGQKRPNVIVLTQPKRFGLDISDYMAAVRVAENVDFSRRYKLYDLYEDILMDTHLSCVLEKRKNAVLCSNMEFRVDGKPDDKINEQIQSPWFNRLVGDILDAKFWGFSLCPSGSTCKSISRARSEAVPSAIVHGSRIPTNTPKSPWASMCRNSSTVS